MRFINYFSDYLSSRKFISEGRRLFLFSGSSIDRYINYFWNLLKAFKENSLIFSKNASKRILWCFKISVLGDALISSSSALRNSARIHFVCSKQYTNLVRGPVTKFTAWFYTQKAVKGLYWINYTQPIYFWDDHYNFIEQFQIVPLQSNGFKDKFNDSLQKLFLITKKASFLTNEEPIIIQWLFKFFLFNIWFKEIQLKGSSSSFWNTFFKFTNL